MRRSQRDTGEVRLCLNPLMAPTGSRLPIDIAALAAADHAEWLPLARAYRAFDGAALVDEDCHLAWQRRYAGGATRGLGARRDSRLVGFAHFVLRASTWGNAVCYRQDLYVDASTRGCGAARALIGAVAADARASVAAKRYWTTKHDNDAARRLFARLARHSGFVRYDYSIA
ncbi:MAG: GNAT family N-acetyltransferase [Betaproteobacteria bacterium]|jgi:ribosomal protein S18 acetylase RimI-like enzyme